MADNKKTDISKYYDEEIAKIKAHPRSSIATSGKISYTMLLEACDEAYNLAIDNALKIMKASHTLLEAEMLVRSLKR